MNERERCIEEWVFVQLFVFSDLRNLCLDGCRACARSGELLNRMSAICVPETRQEVVVDHFPGYDIEDAGYQSDGEADGKSFEKGSLTIADVVPVGSDADKHHQEREHDRGVADDRAAVEANPAAEGHQRYHHQRGDSAGNQPEGDDDLSYIFVISLSDLDLSTSDAGAMLIRAQRPATSAGDLDAAVITTIRLSPAPG